MNLHHDRDAFEELIIGAANELRIPTNIIEKDYYVTIALKSLLEKLDDMVFKGGTSLTKCYQLLDRFSEDIDLSYTAESGTPGEARKRKLSKLIPEVRAVRSELAICPSAKEGVCIKDVLNEIIEKDAYKSDYEAITMGLLFVPDRYETVIQSIKYMADSGIWD